MIGELARQRTARRARLFLSVALFGAAAGTVLLQAQPATAGPNDPITIGDATLAENGGSMTFTITAAGPVTGTFSTSTDGFNPATSGNDCSPTSAHDFDDVATDETGETTSESSTFTILASATSTTVTVPLCGDTVPEPNETFKVTLTQVVGASCTTSGADCTAVGTILNDDASPAVLSITDASATEAAGATMTFALTLDKPSPNTSVVTYKTTNDSATSASDFTAVTSGTVSFNSTETSKSITITLTNDNQAEPTETFFVDIVSATNVAVPQPRATGTIHDDDTPPAITVVDDATDEGTTGTGTCSGGGTALNQCVVFTVSLSKAAGSTVLVDYRTVDGTATANSDYVPQSSTLTFAAGTTTAQVVKVPVHGDAVSEGTETFSLVLEDPTNATCAVADGADCDAVGSIVEGAIAITVDDATVTEGSTTRTAAVDVNLATTPATTVTATYSTRNGTAVAGTDYRASAPNQTLTFVAGDRTETVLVDVFPDTLDEDAETFFVDVTGTTGQTVCANAASCTGQVTINDDPADTPPSLSINDPAAVVEGNSGETSMTFTVTLSAASGRPVTVDYATASHLASAGSECGPGIDFESKSGTLTFNPGTTTRTLTVEVCGDTVAEANETFFVNLSTDPSSNATVADGQGVGTINNDDGPAPAVSVADLTRDEDTGVFTFTVTLAQTSAKTVTVTAATTPGSASGSVIGGSCSGTIDFVSKTETLTFVPNDPSEDFDVTVCGDTRDEPNESFTVTLSNPENATLGDSTATGTITDDDDPPSVSITGAQAAEDAGSLVFPVQLSAASGRTVNVTATTADGTAKVPGDYAAHTQTFTFDPGETRKDFTVTVAADTVIEDDETMTVTLSTAANATLNPGATTATGTITNDDLGQGYTLAGADGSVYNFGDAKFHGSITSSGIRLNAPIIGVANTPTGNGYWLVARDGGIFTFGDAKFHGSMGNEPLNAPVLGMEPTPSGRGYWLFAADGGIFTFGDATFHGSMGNKHLVAPVIGMATTTSGRGYWLVAQDGGIFSFGDATFHGSMGGKPLNQPVFDMAATSDDGGYWLVARDGGIFSFGTAASRFYGSAVNRGASTVIGMGTTPTGKGYWIADQRGRVFEFGDAVHKGDARNVGNVIVGFASVPRPKE